MKKRIFLSFLIVFCAAQLFSQETTHPYFSADFGATRGFMARLSKAKVKPTNFTWTYSGYLLIFGTDHKVDYEDFTYDPYFTSGLMAATGPQWFVGEKMYMGIDFALGGGLSTVQFRRVDPDFSNSYVDIKTLQYEKTISAISYDAFYWGINFNRFRTRISLGMLAISGMKSIGVRFPLTISAGFNLFSKEEYKKVIINNKKLR